MWISGYYVPGYYVNTSSCCEQDYFSKRVGKLNWDGYSLYLHPHTNVTSLCLQSVSQPAESAKTHLIFLSPGWLVWSLSSETLLPHRPLQCPDTFGFFKIVIFSPLALLSGFSNRQTIGIWHCKDLFTFFSSVLLVIPQFSAVPSNTKVSELLSGCCSLHSSGSEVLHLTGSLTEIGFVAKVEPWQAAKNEGKIYRKL